MIPEEPAYLNYSVFDETTTTTTTTVVAYCHGQYSVRTQATAAAP